VRRERSIRHSKLRGADRQTRLQPFFQPARLDEHER
jgi:hypothetical protein